MEGKSVGSQRVIPTQRMHAKTTTQTLAQPTLPHLYPHLVREYHITFMLAGYADHLPWR
jgi:hypothetical protein